MDPATLSAATVVIAEIALALHPILIKQVGVNLPTQLLARLGTYSVLAGALGDKKDIAFSWGSIPKAFQSILFGLMNLVHIGTSYLSYQHLPAGSALALFYTYPFFNILAGVLFLGEKLDLLILPLMVVAFLGVIMIAKYTHTGDEKEHETSNEAKKSLTIGVAASLISAITETMIFLVAKTGEEPSAFLPVLKLYPGALLGLLVFLGFTGASKTLNFDFQNWIPLLLFNIFVGFLGYSLRFYSIPRLPTAIFSILTFIGVAAGYGWGLAYAKEVPTAGALGGAGLITGALGVLKFLGKA
jgi:drug/metabolite transporter (DMT)-like permease